MHSRLRFSLSCAFLTALWNQEASAQDAAPADTTPAAVAPAAPAALAAAPALAPAAPAGQATPAAAAPDSVEPAAAPAWPQSESECNDWARNPAAAVVPELEAEVAHRYLARFIPVVGFDSGGGLGVDAGYGFRIGMRADIGIASPLWLSGSAYYARTAGKSSGQVDVLTGLNIVSWGPRWVTAGSASAGGVATAWNSHCQQRRNELGLLLGGKLIFAPQGITALQAGFGESFRRERGFSTWSLTGLYDPAHPSYGGQLQLGAGGGFVPYPVYFGTTIGAMGGERKNWWGTIDLGAVFEI